MRLTFSSDDCCYDLDTGTVRFMATDGNGDEVGFAVSEQALSDLEGSNISDAAALPAFMRHSAKIHAVAQRKFELDERELSGMIFVGAVDLSL